MSTSLKPVGCPGWLKRARPGSNASRVRASTKPHCRKTNDDSFQQSQIPDTAGLWPSSVREVRRAQVQTLGLSRRPIVRFSEGEQCWLVPATAVMVTRLQPTCFRRMANAGCPFDSSCSLSPEGDLSAVQLCGGSEVCRRRRIAACPVRKLTGPDAERSPLQIGSVHQRRRRSLCTAVTVAYTPKRPERMIVRICQDASLHSLDTNRRTACAASRESMRAVPTIKRSKVAWRTTATPFDAKESVASTRASARCTT